MSGKNLPREKDLYHYIYNYVKENKKLPSSISKQNAYYYTRKLKKQGLIHHLGGGAWVAYEGDPVKISPKATQTSLNIGGHGFILTFKLPKLNNWNQENIIKYLNKKNIKHIPIGINGLTQRIIHKGHKIWLSNRSITIYMPKGVRFYSHTAKNSRLEALKSLMDILHSLENMFSVSFRFADGYHFKVTRQHFAKVRDELAQHYTKQGKKLEVSNQRGTWLIIDDSLKDGGELEVVHNKTGVSDMDRVVVPFMNSLKDHTDKTGESITIDKLLKTLQGLTKNQQQMSLREEMLMEQIKKLTEVILRMQE